MPKFHKILTVWYQQNARDLPWRAKNDPYFVWVSEIILQQTRVDQGTAYFLRFVERFPDVKSLASAPENEVLKVWQGLGYYSRARNMHAAARQIMNEFNGLFPDTYINIVHLKGIGSYTAAAIASIAFGLPYAAIDGNVYRVLSRVFGIVTPIDSSKGKKEFSVLANQLLDLQNPAIFNVALMEFGALQCTPRNPDCSRCPFQDQCLAFAHNEIAKLPAKSKQTSVKNRFFNYLLIRQSKFIYLEKRLENDIWRNLYQFPLIESPKALTNVEILTNEEFRSIFKGIKIVIDSITPEIIHVLTHQKLHVRFIEITILNPETSFPWIRVLPDDVHEYPVPKLIDNFLLGNTGNKLP
ncbi:MAG: A/G-specific adenine glycosylase [Bacteroidia bacterium]|nr:A/G-specific adenine glycosylase [Bacteroidia bacterium]